MMDTITQPGEPLQFHFGQAQNLLCSCSPPALPFSSHKPQTKRPNRRITKRSNKAPAFASITMSSNTDPGTESSPARVPLFMIASASETKTTPVPESMFFRAWLGNLAAGAIAGCAVEAALYPIDTIKTRLQAMVGGGGFKALMQQGGGKALYAGIWGNLAGVAPSSAIFISVYEPVKAWVQSSLEPERSFMGPLIAGASAGAAASLTRVPTEVIKSRLQTKEFKGALDAISAIARKEGLRGFYQGYGAFMLRDLPFDAIEFVAYEQLKRAFSTSLGRELNPGETSIAGAIAGGFTGIVTTPLDVLKTRLMTQGSNGRYKSLVDATIQIARTEGLGAFMSGWQPRLIWISMGGFVFFPVLEASKKYFGPKLPVQPLH